MGNPFYNEKETDMTLKKLIIWCAVLSIVFFAFGSQRGHAEKLIGETDSIDLSTSHRYTTRGIGETVASFKVGREGATFITVHFTDFSLNDGDYVEIRDVNGVLRQTVTNDDPGRTDFWSFIVDGDTAFVDLISGTSGLSSYGFDIDRYGYSIAEPAVESTCDSDDKVDIECVSGTPQYDRARSVGRMYYQKSGYWYLCTGSLVSPDNHFLSNEHCVNSQAITDTLQVRFNYQYTTCGGSTLASYNTFYGDAFLVSDYGYDLSLMTLSGDPQSTYGYLDLDPRDMVYYEAIYIPQYSGGRPKMYDSGPVVDTVANGNLPGSDFGHRADTEGGSSGSPVLSMTDHKVVGLHHWGGCTSTGGQNQAVLMKNVYPVIAPYLTVPVADIKANNSDGPLTITQGNPLSITVELNAAGNSYNADWWVLGNTPFGWYYYNLSSGWQSGQSVTHQGPLFDLSSYEVLNMSGLPAGSYTFYFGVDTNMNGSIDMGQIYYDSVDVNITSTGSIAAGTLLLNYD
jgi:V8-like Glu-specific endopeptidase